MSTSLAARCEHAFSTKTRNRGTRYREEGRVLLRRIPVVGRQFRVRAKVRGSNDLEYTVSLHHAHRGVDVLTVACECPSFWRGTPCKHIWATIEQVDAMLPPGVRPPGSIPLLVEDGSDDLDTYEDDDTIDAELVGYALSLEADGAPAEPRARRTQWEQRIDRIADEAEAQRAPVRQRILYYVLDLGTSEAANTLELGLRQRTQRKDGGLGQLRPVTREDLPEILAGSPADRKLLGLMTGGSATNVRHLPYWLRAQSNVITLNPDAQEVVLPLLCGSGRFGLLHEEPGGSEVVPLAWDEGEPWSLQLRVTLDEDADRVHIEGSLVREGEIISVDEPLLVLLGGIAVFRDKVGRIDLRDDFAWIASLRSGGPIEVPLAQADPVIERIVSLPGAGTIELPPALAWEQVRVAPRPRASFGAPTESGRSSVVDGQVSFMYGEGAVAPDDPAVTLVDREARRIVTRDREREQQWLAEAPPPYAPKQGAIRVPAKSFATAVRALLEAGWVVEAMGERILDADGVSGRVESGIDWFEVEGVVAFEGTEIALPKLLKLLRQGEDFIPLEDGSRGVLPRALLERLGPLLDLGTDQNGRLRFHRNQAGLLDVLLLAKEQNVDVDEEFEQLRRRLREVDRVEPAPAPPGFVGTLREYQSAGLGWLEFLREVGLGGCLADDMGLGKTVQVLALLAGRAADRPNRPALVIVPRSLVHNWIEEAERFAPELRAEIYWGPQRKKLLERVHELDLVVSTYGTIRRDAPLLASHRFDTIVLDEASAIKNAGSQTAKACRVLQSDHRLALSGTPVENRLEDVWSIFDFLNPGMLGRITRFSELARTTPTTDTDTPFLDLLREAFRPFILRRTKEQVLTELPPKSEQIVLCDLPDEQRHLYDELLEYYRSSLKHKIKTIGLEKSKVHVLEALLRLRQAACHPGLVDRERRQASAAKLDLLLDQLAEVVQSGHKALVFSQFVSLLTLVRERLDVPYAYLDGSTRRRGEVVERFQNDPECRVFLISIKAGGHGLNLTAADYVFILDPWWNPAVEAQAIDRSHRIGQTRPVLAYRLIARDTVEQRILDLQSGKRELAEALVSPEEGFLKRLSASDLQALLD